MSADAMQMRTTSFRDFGHLGSAIQQVEATAMGLGLGTGKARRRPRVDGRVEHLDGLVD